MCWCALSGGCACDEIDRLSPAVREEVQDYYVRAYFARKRRALCDEKVRRAIRYDTLGRPITESERQRRPRPIWNSVAQAEGYANRRR